MATSSVAAAHISTNPFNSPSFSRSLPPNLTSRTTPKLSSRVRCALRPPKWRESRRLVSVSLVLMNFLAVPKHSMANSIMDNYVKRKKLDPLEAYVPAVILTQLQIKDLEKTLDVDQPQYATCRSLLRSGPAASLRVNIRAVAQYASDSGNGKTAFDNVDQCLRALEDLDSLFLRASRNNSEASVPSMRAKIGLVVNALDSLLQTVPSGVLDKGKAIADSYRTLDDVVEPDISDPEMKRLESLL